MITPEIKELYASVDWSEVDFTKINDELAEHVLSRLGPLRGKRILDLGCGSATLCVELALRGFDVVGLDLHVVPARARAKARRAKFPLLEQDMSEMNFMEEFAAIVNWDVSGIGLLASDEANIDIVRRVYDALLPGGKFLMETYNLEFIKANPGRVEGLTFKAQTHRCVPVRSEKSSIRLFAKEEWQTIAEEIGFTFLQAWGDLDGRAFGKNSRMLVFVCEKGSYHNKTEADDA